MIEVFFLKSVKYVSQIIANIMIGQRSEQFLREHKIEKSVKDGEFENGH